MGLVLILVTILIFFHREILFCLIRYCSHSQQTDLGAWSIPVLAQMKSKPKIYLETHRFAECLSLDTLWAPIIFVNLVLWNSLTDDEKACYVAWCLSANLRNSCVERLLVTPKVEVVDRDLILLSDRPLAVSSLLKKMIRFRIENPPSAFGNAFLGLSFLGSSLFGEWPSHDERLKNISAYLAQLNKSQ